jgi:hypothetical protein
MCPMCVAAFAQAALATVFAGTGAMLLINKFCTKTVALASQSKTHKETGYER